jgi:hypothetical protein
MKKIAGLLIYLGYTLMSYGQVSILCQDESGFSPDPHPSAVLDLKSGQRGFLIPRMQTSEKLAIQNPATGLCVYDMTIGAYSYYNGTQWLPFGSDADSNWIINGNNMYANVSGNVGVGTTNPIYKFTVDSGDALIIGNDGWNGTNDDAHLFLGDGNHAILARYGVGIRIRSYNSTAHDIRIGAINGVDYMTIKMSTGRVGIGTTAPDYLLDVAGPVNLNKGITSGTAMRINNSPVIDQYSGYLQWGGSQNSYFSNSIGIGTNNPATKLHIVGEAVAYRGQLCIEDNIGNDPFISFYQGTTLRSFIGYVDGVGHWGTTNNADLIISGYEDSGDVGIGTMAPDVRLHVNTITNSDVELAGGGILELGLSSGNNIAMDGNEIMARNNSNTAPLYLNNNGGNVIISQSGTGNVGIGLSAPASRLDVKGNITVRDATSGSIVMELGTGLDYAEGFNLSNNEEIVPGTVLVIDPENPGKLMVSESAYDSKVAGIVAGANGLGSGIKLGVEQFDCDVALAGRVYCNVDATSSAVEPGDLLTTSEFTGYAMKAQDPFKIHGAILGKAMERMEKGNMGQIMVLVSLQ